MTVNDFIKPIAANQKIRVLIDDGFACAYEGDKMYYDGNYGDKIVDVVTGDKDVIEILTK